MESEHANFPDFNHLPNFNNQLSCDVCIVGTNEIPAVIGLEVPVSDSPYFCNNIAGGYKDKWRKRQGLTLYLNKIFTGAQGKED